MKRLLFVSLLATALMALMVTLPTPASAADRTPTPSVQQQGSPEAAVQHPMHPRIIDPEILRLERELQQARIANDEARFRTVGANLENAYARIRPADTRLRMADIPHEVTRAELPPAGTGLARWGDDALVFASDLYSDVDGTRQIAIASDSTGAIYVAGCFRVATNTPQIIVYRSTDNGATWDLVNGFVYGSSSAQIQSIGMAIADTTDGHWRIGVVWVITSTTDPLGGSDIEYGSFLEDGSSWRYTTIQNASGAVEYHNPSITTDGYHYAPGLTYWYVAAERRTPGSDSVLGACAFRSTNSGITWPLADTNASSWSDTEPQIMVHAAIGGSDTVYIASTRTYGWASPEIRLLRNRYDFVGGTSTNWDYQTITNTYYEKESDHSLAISNESPDLIISFTRDVAPGNRDLFCAVSRDKGTTFTFDTIANSAAHDEWFSNIHCTYQDTYPWFRVVYKIGSDSIAYATGDPPVTTFNYKINQFAPSGVVRPVIGAHPAGAGLWNGGIAYPGLGPTNIYFDAYDLSLAVESGSGKPSAFRLEQNYPNPFNPATTIAYELPHGANVTLTIHNLLGQVVATPVNGRMEAGRHTVTFDASRLASGVYLYQLSAGTFVQTRKMLLLK